MDIYFTNRLIELRKAHKLSGYSFAKKLNIPQPTYLRYETGEQKPSAKLIKSLVTVCRVNVYWLFTGEGTMFLDFNKNSLERHYDPTVYKNLQSFGMRLSELQSKNNLSCREMSHLLMIEEKYYKEILSSEKLPTLDVVNKLKENFQVDVDELLYGQFSPEVTD